MTSRPALLRLPMVVPLLAGIFFLMLVAALYFGRSLLVPIAVAALCTLLLRPLVRLLKQRGIPDAVGAALVVFGFVALVGLGIGLLAGPAAVWLRRAPAEIGQVEVKLRRLMRPFTAIRQTAERVERAAGTDPAGTQTVEVQASRPLRRLGWTTASIAASTATTVFLTYFLLATGTTFRRKVVELLDESKHEALERAFNEIERQMSRYLLFNTLISAAVGLATFGLLAAIGMPNPMLFAACAFLLNYIPYLGAVATIVIIFLAALLSFEGFDKVLLACGGFFLINLIETNLLTPTVLGRKLPLNSVAIFVALLFWTWLWGIPGAIMAVPLTVMIQVSCAHVKRLHPAAVLLDS